MNKQMIQKFFLQKEKVITIFLQELLFLNLYENFSKKRASLIDFEFGKIKGHIVWVKKVDE